MLMDKNNPQVREHTIKIGLLLLLIATISDHGLLLIPVSLLL